MVFSAAGSIGPATCSSSPLCFLSQRHSRVLRGFGDSGLGENRLFFLAMTVGLLWITIWANMRGLDFGKWISNSGGAITIALAFLLILLGAITTMREHTDLSFASFSIPHGDWQMVPLFGLVCFALVGLELGSVMGDEIRDPLRTLPRTVLSAAVLSGLLYTGATLAILIAVPPRENCGSSGRVAGNRANGSAARFQLAADSRRRAAVGPSQGRFPRGWQVLHA